MDAGQSTRARDVCRSIAVVIVTASSAYLLLELVIALSAQGEPTGAVVPFTGAEFVYPIWYQAPEFLDAARVAAMAYPVAGVFYGLGMLARWLGRPSPVEQPRMPAGLPVPETVGGLPDHVVPVAEVIDDFCVVSADRRILRMTPFTARLFGLTPRDMLDRSLEVFLSPADLPKLDALVAAAYADRPRAFATTVNILLSEAAVAPVDITCRAAEGGDGENAGTAILTIRPFSERGRLDDQLAALWY